jgi:uncharacterized protein YjbI with pentapeptide repeats
MSTIVPFPVLVAIGLAGGALVAWVLARRDSGCAEVVPAPPGSVLVLDVREESFAALREFAEQAQANPALRQDWVDEVFAHLRGSQNAAEPWQLLASHLRPGTPGFWPGIDLRVDFQVLVLADLRGCEIRDAVFRQVRFWGPAMFDDVVFTGRVTFEQSWFAYHAQFRGAEFRAGADFEGATFSGNAVFAGMTSGDVASFDGARFSARADFAAAEFGGDVSFLGTGFAGRTTFRDARFAAEARFLDTRFSSHADFAGATAGAFRFAGASARTDVRVVRTWPAGVSLGEPEVNRPWAGVRAD